MEVEFEIVYAEKVVKKDIPKLLSKEKELIKRKIEDKLGKDPIFFGKPLRYSLKSLRSLRVGDFRVVFTLTVNQVRILAIKHRSLVYKEFK